MPIIPQPGWKIDPNNPNAVIRDVAPIPQQSPTPQVGISNAEVNALASQGYREGDTVPGKGILLPDGTFRPVAPAPGSTGSIITPPSATTGAPTPTTPGSVASIYTPNPADSTNQTEIDKLIEAQRAQANQTVDPNQIYNQMLSRRQAEINAINAVYADKLNQARVQGQGRIESRQFAQGRAGQIGSGTGEAGINTVQDANKAIEDSIRNEQALAIQNIYSKVDEASRAEAAAKTLAKTQGADKLLETLKSIPEQRKKVMSSVIADLVSQGVDVSTMTPEELNSYITGLKTTKNEFLGEYQKQKKAIDEANLKVEQDKAKQTADLALKEAQTKQTQAETKQIGKMTPYQQAQLAFEKYKFNNPNPSKKKVSEWESKVNTYSNIEQAINTPGARVAVTGEPVVYKGYFTPEGFKSTLSYAMSQGISRKDFIHDHADKIYKKNLEAYGVKDTELQ